MSNNRRRLTGTVTSNKMDKTVVVQVTRTGRHPLYGKVIRTHKKFMAHDEENACEIGDTVIIVESRPMSRNKRWAVQEIVREDLSARATEVDELADETVVSDSTEVAEPADTAEDAK